MVVRLVNTSLRLVASHIPCPPLSSYPNAHSFVLGTAVINNNDKYIGNILPNCVADAQDMGACCENQLGFDKTIVLTDANRAEIMRVVRAMRDDHVKDGSLVLGFFSRHGVEHEGISYLLPIGMESQNEQDLEEEAVSAHWIILLYNIIILMLLIMGFSVGFFWDRLNVHTFNCHHRKARVCMLASNRQKG